MKIIGNDWDELLKDEFEKEYYKKLMAFLEEEYATKTIFPEKANIFNALKLTPYSDTKVVIIGQDPYPNPNQAHGLAFSVQPGVGIPRSLMNIYKEIHSDLGIDIPKTGYLEKWAKEGVLLLNNVLTVRAGEPNSHKNKGWEKFTDNIISIINNKNHPVVYILWGNNAKEKEKLITNKNHYILTAAHPSPLSASRGFFGCKHFSRTNEILIENKIEPIDWKI